ncbi:MAG TPA: GNAT family N-acetyltransferase [Sphingobium sp.]|nr:GNAT family N-acetyltransferase [Sphingobium sp.]
MAEPGPPTSLRAATAQDVAALAALKLTTFRQTFLEEFAIPYPAHDLARFEAETYGEARIAAELADPAHHSWVCEAPDGTLLAYAHAGPCKLPHPDVTPRSGELYQLYVSRAAQGMGLGRQLLATALDWLATTYPGPLWIGVWSHNARAQAVYAGAGFRKVGEYHFMVGDHRDEEYIFRRD